jgi:hypothetical protein
MTATPTTRSDAVLPDAVLAAAGSPGGSGGAWSAGVRFSWNLLDDWQQIVHFEFMRHALLAGGVAAALCGVVGYFVVLAGCPSPPTRSPTSASPAPRGRWCSVSAPWPVCSASPR